MPAFNFEVDPGLHEDVRLAAKAASVSMSAWLTAAARFRLSADGRETEQDDRIERVLACLEKLHDRLEALESKVFE